MLIPQIKAPGYIIAQPTRNRNGQQCYPLIADTLDELHDIAIMSLSLSPKDFEPDFLGFPAYMLPMGNVSRYLHIGLKTLPAYGFETGEKTRILQEELAANPSRGTAYAQSVAARHEEFIHSQPR